MFPLSEAGNWSSLEFSIFPHLVSDLHNGCRFDRWKISTGSGRMRETGKSRIIENVSDFNADFLLGKLF